MVDIFDALTADRPYRKAKTEEWALENVQSESGAALEPKLVECFSALHRDGVIRGAAHAIPESARRRWSPRRLRGGESGCVDRVGLGLDATSDSGSTRDPGTRAG